MLRLVRFSLKFRRRWNGSTLAHRSCQIAPLTLAVLTQGKRSVGTNYLAPIGCPNSNYAVGPVQSLGRKNHQERDQTCPAIN